ncbi:hypothetical protein F4703DRAFT_1719426, partial [Phycomyces blakesleeanus]
RVLTVKASIKATGWNPELLRPLQVLVAKLHTIVTHTFALSKHIFLAELALDPFFDLNGQINQPFFVEVFLSLIDRNTDSSRITEITRLNRKLISRHINTYIHNSSYARISLLNAHQ